MHDKIEDRLRKLNWIGGTLLVSVSEKISTKRATVRRLSYERIYQF